MIRSFVITDVLLRKYYNTDSLIKGLDFVGKTKICDNSINYCLESINSEAEDSSINSSIEALRFRKSLAPALYGLNIVFSKYKVSISDIENVNLPDCLTFMYYFLRFPSWVKRRVLKIKK